jgi:hypothetical protein
LAGEDQDASDRAGAAAEALKRTGPWKRILRERIEALDWALISGKEEKLRIRRRFAAVRRAEKRAREGKPRRRRLRRRS